MNGSARRESTLSDCDAGVCVCGSSCFGYNGAQDVAGAGRGRLGADARAAGVGDGVDGLGRAQHGRVGKKRILGRRVEAEAVDEARRLLQSAVVRACAAREGLRLVSSAWTAGKPWTWLCQWVRFACMSVHHLS